VHTMSPRVRTFCFFMLAHPAAFLQRSYQHHHERQGGREGWPPRWTRLTPAWPTAAPEGDSPEAHAGCLLSFKGLLHSDVVVCFFGTLTSFRTYTGALAHMRSLRRITLGSISSPSSRQQVAHNTAGACTYEGSPSLSCALLRARSSGEHA